RRVRVLSDRVRSIRCALMESGAPSGVQTFRNLSRVAAPLRRTGCALRFVAGGLRAWITFRPGSRPHRVARKLLTTFETSALGQRLLSGFGRRLQPIEDAAIEQKSQPVAPASSRPRLAFVSPLPPERTGIADASADLLAALAAHYDITLVVDQDKVVEQIATAFPVRDSAWLLENVREIDRVVYQLGNSHFHEYMHDLIMS